MSLVVNKMVGMKSKILIGRGTLESFNEAYDKLSDDQANTVNASQLFPTKETEEGYIMFEFIIYYKTMEIIQTKQPEVKQELKPVEEMRI